MTASPRSDPWSRGLALLRDGRGAEAEAVYRPLLRHPEAALGVARSFHVRSMHSNALPFYELAIAGLSDPIAAKLDASNAHFALEYPENALELRADLPQVSRLHTVAGARLARPVWLLNRFDACWRWLRGRDDSPFYLPLRQFRQLAPGDWATPLATVRTARAEW
jgi:hypothetical protein